MARRELIERRRYDPQFVGDWKRDYHARFKESHERVMRVHAETSRRLADSDD